MSNSRPRFVSASPNITLSTSQGEETGYVGLDLLQEQIRVKALRKGFVFNLMVAGRSGLGKSTLVDTLFKDQVSTKKHEHQEIIPPTTKIRWKTCCQSENGVKLSLTIIDTPGFGDQVNNENCWEPLVKCIEEQHAKYLAEEQKLSRPILVRDTRVHCCLYFIQPSGHALSSLDIEVLKRLCTVVNVVPVIAKADTLTLDERKCFKERIRADLNDHKVKVYPVVDFEDQEDVSVNEKIRGLVPFAVVGSTTYHDTHGRKVLGRRSNWGLVEVENKNHSDFPLLRDMLIRTHMTDLIDVTAARHYETYRQKMLSRKVNHETMSSSTSSVSVEEKCGHTSIEV